ncbi:MAG: hypothetical protein WD768_20245 [Phycisphaeraceae bacterium]
MKKIVTQMTADKKKFGLMLGLLLIASVMGVRALLSGGQDTPASAKAQTGEQGGVGSESAETDLLTLPVVLVELSDVSRRDLFALQSEKFARITKQTTQVTQNSVPEPSEEQKRTQAATALNGLKLRSTLMSANPQALINDKLFGVGNQPVPGFVVTRITQHSVFMKHETFQGEFELKMYRDQ